MYLRSVYLDIPGFNSRALRTYNPKELRRREKGTLIKKVNTELEISSSNVTLRPSSVLCGKDFKWLYEACKDADMLSNDMIPLFVLMKITGHSRTSF